ncbi:MAG: DUF4444 domain-containing protein [Pseudomonadota bacterium]
MTRTLYPIRFVGLDLMRRPETDDPGHRPDQTTLYAEGCADVDGPALLESWVKHTSVHINRWQAEGSGAIHKDWPELCCKVGKDIEFANRASIFLGVNKTFDLLLRDAQTTHLIPLTQILEP